MNNRPIFKGLRVMVTDDASPFNEWGGDVVAVREGLVVVDASYMGQDSPDSPDLRLTFSEEQVTVLAPLDRSDAAWSLFNKWQNAT